MQPVPSSGTSSPAPWLTLWSLREDTLLEEQPQDDSLLLRSRWGDLRIPHPGPVLAETLRRMLLGPIQLENVPGTDELSAQVRLLAALRQLRGMVVRSVGAPDGSRPLLSVVPVRAGALLDPQPVPEDRLLRLSRFAVLRSTGRGTLLESPLSAFSAAFSRPEAGWLLASLGRPVTLEQAAGRLPIPPAAASALVAHLVATGMVEFAEHGAEAHNASFGEDRDPVLLPWSPHDLRFHWSSRPGLHDRPVGATFRLRGRQEQPPALKPLPAGPRIPLPRPAPGTPPWDLPLTEALERRRSVRRYGEQRMTLGRLGDLLYHALRVREADGGREDAGAQSRPYPSGGACYELECYLTVGRCAGLEAGSYAYDPLGHALIRLSGDPELDRTMLREAQTCAGAEDPPDVLLTLAARFARVSWKYSGLAYALTLKHVGVVQQTLYLLATAMGLGGCALGTGNTGLSAEAFGLDWRAESAVGEFILGSLPAAAAVG
ncbi:SagB family peptide dehydrogenase [Kitasatospora sp. NPDC089797]|uniref:SagB/ThcOx family dehydrogenase n=1 Tax=Kitasatospora sp. NPDC089797 TaxID=3155298 RepID=UPI00344AF296